MGLLERRPGYYRAKITLTVAAYAGGWVLFVLAGNSWTALAVAPLLGVIFTQLGSIGHFTQLGFIGHDAGHNQVYRTRRRNRILGLAAGNALIGLSFGWWVPKHNAHPNEIGRDPDLAETAPPAPGAPGDRPGAVADCLARWQAPMFFPLMLLRSSGMHVLGIKRLCQRRDHAAAAEAACCCTPPCI